MFDQPLGLLGRRCRLALAGQRSPDIIDHDVGAGPRHRECDLPADAAAGACDDGDFAFQHAGHGVLLPGNLGNSRSIKRLTPGPVNPNVNPAA